jgi:hypothetical protein
MSRADEKQASRDEDARRLAAAEVTASQLTKENSFFNLDGGVKIDWEKTRPRVFKGAHARITMKLPDGRVIELKPFKEISYNVDHEDLKMVGDTE